MSRDNEHGIDDRLDDVADEWDVSHVLAALGEVDAIAPAATTRDALLAQVAASPRQLATPLAVADLYVSRARAMVGLLEQLDGSVWQRRAAPYDWTVHGLIAHLLVIEQYTAAQFGLGAVSRDNDAFLIDDHLQMGAEQIALELLDSPAATTRRWAAAAQRIVNYVQSSDFRADRAVTMHGWPFSASAALVARAFELWTHTDDIRRAAGLDQEPPSAAELRTMSSYSVASLPFLLPTVASHSALAPTRVVLTGSGGGTYDIGGAGERAALLVADVVEYCRVVARRVEPSDLAATIEGDDALVHALLTASRAFAV
ncbi:MAG: maleylpyruvate isomerase family mycothiol-dependent enzyme [Actinomycetia bacterium]|nr:maleylpyruvate isomerase family mycothiol-dependent enzyme [Actinomycetes bacterium]